MSLTVTVRAYWMSAVDTPLTGPAGANIPDLVIVRDDTLAVVAGPTQDLVEQTNAGGLYTFDFTPPDYTITYSVRADGDPAAIGQVQAGTRYMFGGFDARDVAARDAINANVDVVLSTRSSHSAADVDTTLSGTHGAGSWATATGFAVPGDAMALTPAERTTLAGVIDTTLGAAHGVGSWATAVGFSTHTAADVDTVLTGTHGAGAWTTATGFSTHSAADVDTVLTGTHGAGSWATATGFAVAGDAMTLTGPAETSLLAVFDTAHGVGSWVGAGLTGAQATQLEEVWQFRGLDIANPAELAKAVVGTPGYIRVPFAGTTIDVEVTQVDASTVRLQRQ